MLGTVVMGLLADLVFEAAASSGSAYRSEIHRYLQQRGLPTTSPPPRPSAK